MSEPVTREPSVFPVPEAETVPYDCNPGIPEAMFDTDPVEPPEVAAWNKAQARRFGDLIQTPTVKQAGDALATALVAASERAETAERMLETSESLRQDYDLEALLSVDGSVTMSDPVPATFEVDRDVTVSIRQTSRWFWYIDAGVGWSHIVGGKFAFGEKRAIKKAERWRRTLELDEQRFATRRELEKP